MLVSKETSPPEQPSGLGLHRPARLLRTCGKAPVLSVSVDIVDGFEVTTASVTEGTVDITNLKTSQTIAIPVGGESSVSESVVTHEIVVNEPNIQGCSVYFNGQRIDTFPAIFDVIEGDSVGLSATNIADGKSFKSWTASWSDGGEDFLENIAGHNFDLQMPSFAFNIDPVFEIDLTERSSYGDIFISSSAYEKIINSPNFDIDYDGYSNLLEHAFGTALDGVEISEFLPTTSKVPEGLQFEFSLPAATPIDISYIVESSHTLDGGETEWIQEAIKNGRGAWAINGDGTVSEISESIERVITSYNFPLDITQNKMNFMRVRAVLAEP